MNAFAIFVILGATTLFTKLDSKITWTQCQQIMADGRHTLSDSEAVVRRSDRTPKMSSKGLQYELELRFKKRDQSYRAVSQITDEIRQGIKETTEIPSLHSKYSTWLQKYEDFLAIHERCVELMDEEQRQSDVREYFRVRETECRNLKTEVEKYICATKSVKADSIRSGSSRSSHSSRRSRMSKLDYSRLEEQQKKAELTAKVNALQQQREIEQAKLDLKMKEQELQLKTELAIEEAKSDVLNDFEERLSFKPAHSSVIDPTTFIPPKPAAQSVIEQVHFDPNASVFVPQPKVNLSKETVTDSPQLLSVARELRKPVSDIQKFAGGPMDYKRFMRQFDARIVTNTDSFDERMNYLDQFTVGEANRIVKGYANLDSRVGYSAVMEEFASRYGDPDVIVHAYVKRALDWPVIKPENAKALDEFSIFLRECEYAAQSVEAANVLEYSENLRSLVSKLPYYLHDRWRTIVQDTKERNGTLRFSQLVDFVRKEAKKANDPTFGKHSLVTKQTVKPMSHTSAKRSFAIDVAMTGQKPEVANDSTKPNKGLAFQKPCVYCQSPQHTLDCCLSLKSQPLKNRYDFLKSKGLCFACLKSGHQRFNCRHRPYCTTCNKCHPSVLHVERNNQQNPPNAATSEVTNTVTMSSVSSSYMGAGAQRSAVAIVPVRVEAKNSDKFVETHAFLDAGSTATFCSEQVMRQLGVEGKKTKIVLCTMGNERLQDCYVIPGLEITSVDGEHVAELPPVLTQPTLPVTGKDIITSEDLLKWPYLQDVPLPEIDGDAHVGLLIGVNAPRVMEPHDVIPSKDNGPFAVKTMLGWVINGPIDISDERSHKFVSMNRISIREVPTLEDQLNNHFDHDFSEKTVDDVPEPSIEDKQFLRIASESVQMKDGHYTIRLPLRCNKTVMPNNRKQAEQRLALLTRRFDRDGVFHEEYKSCINKLLNEGHARQVPSDQLDQNDGRVWYLPHHGVHHPVKKKLRVVFDCAARYGGTSLNEKLLQGPNLTNTLIGTLTRFRQGNIALMSDIESMFHQVRVPDEDTSLLRFLWYQNGDISQPVTEYQMVVHLFGAASSPACANFALRKTATDNKDKYCKEATDTILNNFYVDDCLKSVDSVGEAISLCKELRDVCSEGGFHLTKWISSSREVMDSIPDSERAKDVQDLDLDQDTLPIERALGVKWCVETDKFMFKIDIKDKPTTRRGILTVVSSIYDPLGFLAPYVLKAKLILQELCRVNLAWDEAIPDRLAEEWTEWKTEVQKLESFHENRCFKPVDFGDIQRTELHHFSDACEQGYGVVSYLRLVNIKGDIHCSFVMGKSRVAPLKSITVPRLELTAATIAVRIDKLLRKQLEISIDKSYFWTDSMSVILYIRNATSRFHTFVANRLAVIHEGSDTSQWRYVNTKLNPADEASRGLSADELTENCRWVKGPKFLWNQESEWPENAEISDNVLADDPEVKRVKVSQISVSTGTSKNTDTESPTDRLINYHSSWFKLRRAVAWILRVKQMLMLKVKGQKVSQSRHITVAELDCAEVSLLKYCQRSVYAEEIKALNEMNGSVKQKSSIRKLDPIIEDGLLRVGGRLNRSSLPENMKHPVIIPKDSHIATLILRQIHVKLGHSGRNHVLSELRKRYWIIQGPSAVRRILSRCVTCKRLKSPVLEQKMSDLPGDRLVADEPPFSYVGVDYFGPFHIKRGRSLVKRFGVLFTCLTVRAIHLEVAASLDTDSYIQALPRFIARRGQVKSMRSDNGTNLVSAERELREAIKSWNLSQIHSDMLQLNIDWTFNPPTGSHHGGVWERQIRTVRKILNSLIKEQGLDDEGFHTLLCEVEAIVNSRPITKLSDQHDDLEALTPNHLLLMKTKPNLPPGVFSKDDLYCKRRWRQVQYMSNIFWKRWVHEYLPLLQERQKWCNIRQNLKVGDIVLLVDAKAPRNSWPMGRVLETMPDRKGFVRQVKVKTQTSTLVRPIDKLCLVLEMD